MTPKQMCWQFSGGKWLRTNDPVQLTQEELETGADCSAARGRSGFEWFQYLGDPDWEGATVYVRETVLEGMLPPEREFYAEVTYGGTRIEAVYLPAYPDLVEFTRMIAPVATTEVVKHRLSHIEEAVEKLFRAEHGHSIFDCCSSCDPDQVERDNLRRAREADHARALARRLAKNGTAKDPGLDSST